MSGSVSFRANGCLISFVKELFDFFSLQSRSYTIIFESISEIATYLALDLDFIFLFVLTVAIVTQDEAVDFLVYLGYRLWFYFVTFFSS